MIYNNIMTEIDIQSLEWDHVNGAHIWEAHRITRQEVEEVCFGDPAQMLVKATYSGRLRIIGPRNDGKILVVILNPKGNGRYYPVTAKPTKRQEQRRYLIWKTGGQL